MASGSSHEATSAHTFEGLISDQEEVTVCGSCKKSNAELHAAKLELSSLREIIKVLQEETRASNPSSQFTINKGTKLYEDEDSQPAAVNGEWTTISSRRRRKHQYLSRNLRQLPIVTTNQYEVLDNLKNDSVTSECVPPVQSPNPTMSSQSERRSKFQSVSERKHTDQEIIIVGDSHGSRSAAELEQCLDPSFKIFGYVQSGAEMKAILSSMQADIKKLRRNDVVVIWGGSNDIGRNNSNEALKHLCNFVENNQKVNIVVMAAPPRYDLMVSSCVNAEVTNFNRKLKKRMVPYNNVKIIATDLERDFFTKHGRHLNTSGKECIAQRLATVVRSFRSSERMPPISLWWKDGTPLFDLNGNEFHTTVRISQTAPKLQLVTNRDESLGSEAQASAELSIKNTEEVQLALSPNLQLPIILEKSLGSNVQVPVESSDEKNEDDVKSTPSQPPKRQRIKPAVRSQDFLWIM
jgi:lysophospholipase L1-like esterase